jgi:DNA polymerase-3 subunit epsilon/oligoribonuclease
MFKLIFIDIETTGTDFYLHMPLEICVRCTNQDLSVVFEYNTLLKCSKYDWSNADKKALNVNGIKYKDVENAECYESCTYFIKNLFATYFVFPSFCHAFVSQNPSFDRFFLTKIMGPDNMVDLPYHWLDLASMYYAKNYPSLNQMSLSKDYIAKSLEIEPESKPHRAINGVDHLMKCYNKLIIG